MLLKLLQQVLRFTLNKKTKIQTIQPRVGSVIRSIRFKKTINLIFGDAPKNAKLNPLVTGTLVTQINPVFNPQKATFPRGLFHIKCLFELEEFAAYDYFNFQKASVTSKKIASSHLIANEPIRLNFFYKIRTAIWTFRTNTLLYFGKFHKTEHRTNLFFKALTSVSTLSYMWFLEFNLAVFLLKINFCNSIQNGLNLIATSSCTLNSGVVSSRWVTVNPGDLVQLPTNAFFLWWLGFALNRKLNAIQKHTRLIQKLFFRKREGGVKTTKKKKSLKLTWSKQKPFQLCEIDPKTASVFLLPYKNNYSYFKLTFTLWLNYWNYRVVLWKYRT